ncbi:MAG: hypothetical protein PWQ51_374 [Methanolobus sp.]|jgi:hypothetical protein|uniref:nucleotidyltransferase n=1 Tax=Methanolobus sp. TaxID=1874737 RepID=UPI002588A9DF|nr:DUF6036 family nucleotidyltransferase [Methanolobus sp.]MDK2832861.1 hypothetical protein [Methanolobus sp.]MDK2938210.1 hypothetical protein [Methanolobus sp.]
MSPKLFDRQYLENEFEKLNQALKEHVNLYLIGGGSMSFQKYKAATKDIDVVVRSNNELHQVEAALRSIGYIVPAVRGPYDQMEASAILENPDGFRWDIFVNMICGGLQLSEGMIKRSHELFKMQNVSVYMISPEDIFVFKSITTRERDKEDMYSLFSKGLDFDIIKNEFFWQNEHRQNDYEWMAFFFDGLEEFFDKYHISHPIIKELHDIAEKDMFIGIIKNRLRSKSMKIDELSADIDPEYVKTLLESLLEQGYVIQDEQGKFLLTEDKS